MNRFCFALLLGLLMSACHSTPPPGPAPSAAACSLDAEIRLNVSGLANGIYGVVGDEVQREPLARFDQMKRVKEGQEASGKPWMYVRLEAEAASRLLAFTQAPENKSIAVVSDGRLSSHHKIRAPLTSNEFQLSCCDASACDRWRVLVAE